MLLEREQDIKHAIVIALREDRARDDITSEACLPIDVPVKAEIVLKEPAIIAGLPFLSWVFEAVDPEVRFEICIPEGSNAKDGTILARLRGKARSLLAAERTALNILQHTSGIATLTNEYVNEVQGYCCDILDTRKTLPGLRALQKYAVRVGGGKNHRFHLQEAFLIKNNHIKVLKKTQQRPIQDAVERARQLNPDIKIEVEVENLNMLQEALESQPDLILLDNMSIEMMKEAVQMTENRAYLEASGGMNLSKVRATAEAGVNGISIGALTHSVEAIDISLRIDA